MSVAAVMLVKDEADIIETTVRHLLEHVDEILVADNGSTDGTREILEEFSTGIVLSDDSEPGYYQARKTTALALSALSRGHRWVVPCDADEIWYSADGRFLRDFFDGVVPDVQLVRADLFNHLPTALDPDYENPVMRIGWRQRQTQALGKVACRLRPDLKIHQGNHGAETQGTGLTGSGLVIRHFSWRTAEQYLRKIRNGEAAYAATTLPPDTGLHWRMFADHTDETIREHFATWFFSEDPLADDTLIYDLAPTRVNLNL